MNNIIISEGNIKASFHIEGYSKLNEKKQIQFEEELISLKHAEEIKRVGFNGYFVIFDFNGYEDYIEYRDFYTNKLLEISKKY